jgi:hypothetical protein
MLFEASRQKLVLHSIPRVGGPMGQRRGDVGERRQGASFVIQMAHECAEFKSLDRRSLHVAIRKQFTCRDQAARANQARTPWRNAFPDQRAIAKPSRYRPAAARSDEKRSRNTILTVKHRAFFSTRRPRNHLAKLSSSSRRSVRARAPDADPQPPTPERRRNPTHLSVYCHPQAAPRQSK